MKPLPHEETVACTIEPFRDGRPQGPRTDVVAVEAPLEIRFDGNPGTIMMRTPGHDDELVRGFLFAEGIIRQASDILALDRPTGQPEGLDGHLIDIRLSQDRKQHRLDRTFLSSSSCGACGKTSFDALAIDAPKVESRITVRADILTRLPDRLKASQSTFQQTGGVHASGLFTPEGELIALREDVGRHNALDKLIGWAVAENRLPLDQCVLVLSGRISYELVQKAVMASIPMVAAVGAPSSMAIEIADRYGITLAGFLRPNSMNAYTHASRIR
jgi:FdhD protein